MITRKEKIYTIQILFLLAGLFILIYTYKVKNASTVSQTTLATDQNKTDLQNAEKDNEGNDVFYNIKYSGLDLAGNRYILSAKKAITDKTNQEIINMNFVDAVFYFKDGTELNVSSKNAIYNNKTLDIIFTKNVEAIYEKNKLFSQKAEYSNSKNYVIISNDLRIESEKGNLFADNLFFDMQKGTLNVSSLEDNKVNAFINLK
jgi:lipopolysaccharide export system protein LptA